MTEEMVSEVKKAHSVDELMAEAGKRGFKLDLSKAEEIFFRFNKSGALGDDELDKVSGGACEDPAQKALGM